MSLTRKRSIAAVAVCLLTISAFANVANAHVIDRRSGLMVSERPDRGDARPLSSLVLRSKRYIFLRAPEDVASVTFLIDGAQPPLRDQPDESFAPWDLAGTSVDGTARALDTARLAVGRHRVTADVRTRSGVVRRVAADFTVPRSGTTAPRPSTSTTVSSTTILPSTTTTFNPTTTTIRPTTTT